MSRLLLLSLFLLAGCQSLPPCEAAPQVNAEAMGEIMWCRAKAGRCKADYIAWQERRLHESARVYSRCLER